jgi:hypothetical protein
MESGIVSPGTLQTSRYGDRVSSASRTAIEDLEALKRRIKASGLSRREILGE